jgi:hypothetical protein
MEVKKILVIVAFLKGQAFKWFKPQIRDYLENNYKNRDKVIDNLFTSYNAFTRELKEVFREVDKKRIAKREL